MKPNFETNPKTVKGLVDVIIKLVPKAISQRKAIHTLIEDYVHYEKYLLWNNLRHYIDHDQKALLVDFILPKIALHKKRRPNFGESGDNQGGAVEILIGIVPEAIAQRNNLFALIKTYVHHVKHTVWEDLKPRVKKDTWVYGAVVIPKISTHKPDAWGNFDKNLEWVMKYQRLPNSVRFSKEEGLGE